MSGDNSYGDLVTACLQCNPQRSARPRIRRIEEIMSQFAAGGEPRGFAREYTSDTILQRPTTIRIMPTTMGRTEIVSPTGTKNGELGPLFR